MEVVHSDADLSRYIRDAVKVSNDSPVLLDRFLDNAVEVDVDVIADKDGNVLIGGVMEHIEEAGVHSGDSSCSLPPYSLSQTVQARPARAGRGAGQGAERRRPDEHPVRGADRRRWRGDHLPAGSEPARLAHGAVRVQGHRHAAGEDRGALHGRQDAGRAGRTGRNRAGLLLGQGSDLPVRQVPGRRSDPRPGNALHRRGDGRGPQLRRRVRACAGSRRHQGAGAWARRSSRCAIPTRRACCRSRRTWSRRGYSLVATSGTARWLREQGLACDADQQGDRRPPAHRRPDQERRDRVYRQHHRGQAGDRRLVLDPARGVAASRDVFDHDRRRQGAAAFARLPRHRPGHGRCRNCTRNWKHKHEHRGTD